MTETVEKANVQELKQEMPEIEALVEDNNAPKDDEDQIPVFNRKQVTDIVKRERARALEQGKRKAMMELQQQQDAPQDQSQVGATQAAQQFQQQPTPAQPSSIGGMQQLSPDQIRQMIAQEAPKALQEHAQALQQRQLVDSFVAKMQTAEAKYPGLESKLNELDYSTIAPLIKMANEMENTGDIMNELVENPMKMGNLVSLLYTQPKLASKAIQNLSQSIKQNVEAQAQEKSAQEPFGQIKSSITAGKDDGDMTVSDFRAMFKKQRRNR